jgi:DDE superfamily endonuclease
LCSTRPKDWATTRSPPAWTPLGRWCPSGANASTTNACPDWPINPGEDDPRVFPPEVVVAVKALACELPSTAGVPLARWHCPDLARTAIEQGIVASISGTTIWRWLSADAIKPWQHRSWIFPRDPDFTTKAARVLDLYARRFDEAPLAANEYVISADEKTSVQARIRKHPSTPPAPGRPTRVEHEYARGGALAYLAAWDVHRAQVFGRCEPTTGIDPFDRLVEQVMTSAPYATARRVFWVVDNGSSHRGHASAERLQSRWPTLRLIHLPKHASWLNQVEIYFSVVQRKVIAPNDFHKLDEVETRLLDFQQYYLNRPGMSGDSISWKGWSHVRWFVEEVPAGAA